MTFNPDLPSFLKQTDAQKAAEDARQAEFRQALHGRVKKSAEERIVTRGIEVELAVRASLPYVEPENLDFQKSKLAEAVAQQGRYAEAVEIEPDEAKASEYQAIQEAIERDDDETCDCPQVELVDDPLNPGKQVRIPNQETRALVYSPKHKKVMPLLTCRCGHWNVRALPPVLAELEAQRATADREARQR